MALREITSTIDCERDIVDNESIPEYLRDTQLPSRDAAVSMASALFNERVMTSERVNEKPNGNGIGHGKDLSTDGEAPKSDELEALWPGVHHEFTSSTQRGPSFYLSVGFAAGALISLLAVAGIGSVSHMMASRPAASDNKVTVAGGGSEHGQPSGGAIVGEVLIPAANQYQVQAGDTLAGIAFHNYKRVSPRLLDEICRVNNMRNANVLSLGQKLNLPEYRPSSQIASVSSTSTTPVQ